MLQRLREREEGFTLIELLVVILIIAILAAIAVPVFLNQREKGWQAQLESALKNASTAAESYATGNNGSYDGLDQAALDAEGYAGATDVTLTVTEGDTVYCISGAHSNLSSPAAMAVSSADSTPTENTCAAGVKA